MGMLASYNHKLYNPGVGVMVYSLCAWILISAVSTHAYDGSNQILANVATNTSVGNSSTILKEELTTDLTDSTSKTVHTIDTTNTETTIVNNSLDADDTESNSDMPTVNATFDSSSQSAVSSKSESLLLTTPTPSTESEATAEQSAVNTVNTAGVTEGSLNSSSDIATEPGAATVTNSIDLSTTTHQNTSNGIFVDHSSKAAELSTLQVMVLIFVAAASVIVIILVIAIIIYFSRGRCRQPKRQTEEEYVDCDQELYTALNAHTNFRHHGARADCQPLNLKDEKLITKMEVDEIDDDNCTHNTRTSVEGSVDSGRYLSPEGLVYVTIVHENGNGKKKASRKKQTDDNTVQYAKVDIAKTNKLFAKLQKRENTKRKRKTKSKRKTETKDAKK